MSQKLCIIESPDMTTFAVLERTTAECLEAANLQAATATSGALRFQHHLRTACTGAAASNLVCERSITADRGFGCHNLSAHVVRWSDPHSPFTWEHSSHEHLQKCRRNGDLKPSSDHLRESASSCRPPQKTECRSFF